MMNSQWTEILYMYVIYVRSRVLALETRAPAVLSDVKRRVPP